MAYIKLIIAIAVILVISGCIRQRYIGPGGGRRDDDSRITNEQVKTQKDGEAKVNALYSAAVGLSGK